jgi:tetratricopeptide (TPR) repeat protein
MKRKTVSLCMIVRDEEDTIGAAIKSVLALVDEIVIADTGSSDNTRIIAEGYGARVIDVPWQDDFAYARNATLAEATGDWILVLDADEYLQPIRPLEFQSLLHATHVAGYRLRLLGARDADDPPAHGVVRLFRRHPHVRYVYPVHEQILPSLGAWADQMQMIVTDAPLAVAHETCRADRRAQRRERNLRILHKALASRADEPYFGYQLACESLTFLDEDVLPVAGLGAAREHLESAWRRIANLAEERVRVLPYAPDLAAKLAAALLASGRAETARTEITEARRLCGDHPLLLLQSIASDTRYLQGAAGGVDPAVTAALLVRARRDIDKLRSAELDGLAVVVDPRCRELYPWRYLGELALLECRVGDAAELFEHALTVDERYSFAWLGLAECARYAGDRKRALKLYLRTVTASERNHRAWLRGSSLLDELGFHDNADSWRRKVAVHFPEHPEVLERVGAAVPAGGGLPGDG